MSELELIGDLLSLVAAIGCVVCGVWTRSWAGFYTWMVAMVAVVSLAVWT